MQQEHKARGRLRFWLRLTGFVVLLALCGSALFVAVRWPFTEERVLQALSNATGSHVLGTRFRTKIFPNPGCTVEKLTFSRVQAQPLAMIERLNLRSSWWTVLTLQRRVGHMRLEGLQVYLPSEMPPPVRQERQDGPQTVVGELIADGTTLVFAPREGRSNSTRFAFHHLRLNEVSRESRIRFITSFANPNPPGEVHAFGSVGPFPEGHAGLAPVSGNYALKDGRLDNYEKMSGTVTSKGRFEGKLERISAAGTASFDRFRTDPNHTPIDMHLSFQSFINAITGDVLVQSATVNVLGTHVDLNGTVSRKQMDVAFHGRQARIEDLVQIFSRANPAPIRGPMTMQGRVRIPFGDGRFLERVRLDGTFAIRDARWQKARTQAKINELGARARLDKKQAEDGRTPGTVPTSIEGQASLNKGIATLSRIVFSVPGATGVGGGTYNVLNKRVNLQGTVNMTANVSEATSGIKSALLKPVDFLFRRKKSPRRGATLPVSITGTAPNVTYRIGLRR